MKKEVNIVQLCRECADSLLGFVVVRERVVGDAKKCEACGKKRPVSVYRVTSAKGGFNG